MTPWSRSSSDASVRATLLSLWQVEELATVEVHRDSTIRHLHPRRAHHPALDRQGVIGALAFLDFPDVLAKRPVCAHGANLVPFQLLAHLDIAHDVQQPGHGTGSELGIITPADQLEPGARRHGQLEVVHGDIASRDTLELQVEYRLDAESRQRPELDHRQAVDELR